jgi:hypothetical protein
MSVVDIPVKREAFEMLFITLRDNEIIMKTSFE